MLAGDRAAEAHAEPENLPGELLCLLELPSHPAIVENQGVKVSIPGMENIGDAKSMARAELLDFPQRLSQPAAGNDSVLDQEVRAQPPGG